MRPTIEAEVDEDGNIRPKEPVSLPPGSQLLITVLGDGVSETALLRLNYATVSDARRLRCASRCSGDTFSTSANHAACSPGVNTFFKWSAPTASST